MKADTDWDDLKYLAAVARTGSLARAAEETGVSQATLSRRMRALERETGRKIFHHGARGYALTVEGQALADGAIRMEQVAAGIDLGKTAGPAPVRISAGTWTALDLAQNMGAIWTAKAQWLPDFVHCDLDMDIARREIDIGIRNRRPTQTWLAGQKTGVVDYAVFAASPKVKRWIGPSHDAARTPSGQWVLEHHGADIATRANSPQLARAMAEAGMGRVVLPVFAGRDRPGLRQIGEPIAALQSEEWLVSHHEGRHDPPIRAALSALARYLKGRPEGI